MYIGVDVGGTKTLVATFSDDGVMGEQTKFPTPPDYDTFLTELKRAVSEFTTKDFRAGAIAVPGRMDRKRGVVAYLANLPWRDVPLQADAERLLNCPIALEHDGPLAGLYESLFLPADQTVLYVTISTGIGTGFISHHQIMPELADSEAGHMILPFRGKRMEWEKFTSGRAIVERFGKKAAEITDQATWQRIAHDLAQGFIELIAIEQPDVIVIGGSVGRYFDQFHQPLVQELQRFSTPLLPIPEFKQAERPEEAVIYGCYALARSLWK